MMKKILVPIDFSDLSTSALEFAVHLARPLHAEVHLVHFVHIHLDETVLYLTGDVKTHDYSQELPHTEEPYKENQRKLMQLAAKYSRERITVIALQIGGDFLCGMKHYINKHNMDLVVIGTSGHERINQFFTGNHTEQLIEHLKIPVLSIRGPVDTNIVDIVIGMDLIDEHYYKSAFSMIKVLTESMDARLHIVNVVSEDPTDALLSKLNIVAKLVGLKNYVVDIILSENKMDGFLEYAYEMNAGMVITLSEARSGIHRFFQHSFSTKLTKIASIPVLTMNKKRT